jgi:hypothetical protein
MVHGAPVDGWSVAALPQALAEQLVTEAKRRSFRDPEHMLSNPARRWAPKVPLAEVAQADLDKAAQLMKALAPSLERQNDISLRAAEFERLGVEDYARVFGHAISARYFRKLFKRTIERDGGAEQWARLELYLDDNPARRIDPLNPMPEIRDAEFPELLLAIASCRNPAQPSSLERANLWALAIQNYNGQVEGGKRPRLAKQALAGFLWQHAPWIAKTPNALRVAFDRKLEKWISADNGAAALTDGRERKKDEQRGQPFEQDSIDAIVWHAAANCGGRISQAVRELAEAERLEPQITRALMCSESKSYVPHRLRQALRADVHNMAIAHQGPRAVDCATPSLSLHYRGIYSMTCVMADDFTLPVYCYVEDGQGGFSAARIRFAG